MSNLSVIDFFCGAGGFSEGFKQMGFKIIEGYDHWKPAIDTYNHNFKTESKIKNILEFLDSIEDIENLENTDIIIGSPPCVSFSSSNKSGKSDKSLGLELIQSFLRIVAVKKHQKNSVLKGWFMENVVNSKKYLKDIYTFEDLNLVNWAKQNKINPKSEALNLLDNTVIINSADYGSFQARKRAVSGEIILENKFITPQVTHCETSSTKLKKWNTLGKLLSKMPPPNKEESEEIIKDPVYPQIEIKLNNLTDHFYDSGLYRSEWRQSKEHKVNHYCMGKMSFPENLNRPSRTITATKSGTSREALVYKSEFNRTGNGEYRSPTVREAASIMGFPFTYQFLGSINSKWRLVGNAVCPSVSRALASEVLLQLKIKHSKILKLNKNLNIENVINISDFKEKSFEKQPIRNKNSRFRRHPLKAGNLTVTLSNYDIQNNTKTEPKWFTSVQYGTGVGFKNQKIEDGFFKSIEPIIRKEKTGSEFIKIINNGFSEKITNASKMQEMYEKQESTEKHKEPTELVNEIAIILNNIKIKNKTIKQGQFKVFQHKDEIPIKQFFALYAINKIASIANQK